MITSHDHDEQLLQEGLSLHPCSVYVHVKSSQIETCIISTAELDETHHVHHAMAHRLVHRNFETLSRLHSTGMLACHSVLLTRLQSCMNAIFVQMLQLPHPAAAGGPAGRLQAARHVALTAKSGVAVLRAVWSWLSVRP